MWHYSDRAKYYEKGQILTEKIQKGRFFSSFLPQQVQISHAISAGPILEMRFWGAHLSKKRAFCWLAPPKQMPF